MEKNWSVMTEMVKPNKILLAEVVEMKNTREMRSDDTFLKVYVITRKEKGNNGGGGLAILVRPNL